MTLQDEKRDMNSLEPSGAAVMDPRHADAEYRTFPEFEDWSRSNVDTARWDRYTGQLRERDQTSPDLLRRALEIVKRAAAVDTGAIEGLYEVDRGITLTVAVAAALWEAALDQKGQQARALFESQLRGYDYVLDLATQQVPITEAWIRELHEKICEAQGTYIAYTEVGPQPQTLPLGEYKHLPNHVRRQDGTIHSYAPVDYTPAEMHKLCEGLRSIAFLEAHPVLQASYAHYAFVVIHPFADGNGRVARALASVYTYRSDSIPLLILVDNRGVYMASLEAADRGEFQPFVDFVLERGLDAIRLAETSLRAASVPPSHKAVEGIERLYFTRGGYSHPQVDQTARHLLELFHSEINQQIQQIIAQLTRGSDHVLVKFTANTADSSHAAAKETSRLPVIQGPKMLRFSLHSLGPADAQVSRAFGVEVPKDCGHEDDLVIQNLETRELFEVRMTELIPIPTTSFQMRLTILVEKILREALHQLWDHAAESLKNKGY
jgi:Fic family protein